MTRSLVLALLALAASDDAGTGAQAGGSLPASADVDPDEAAHTPPPAPTSPSPHPAPHTRTGGRHPAVVVDGMIRIPGGKFTMGSSEKSARSNERPARVVSVPPFWIDRTEVTVGAYLACVSAGKCDRPVRSSVACTIDRGDPLLPVSCVTWAMADKHCRAMHKRLPREVEWELAARGHTPVRYPWGTSRTGCSTAVTLIADSAQKSCGKKGPARVGAHPAGASPFGVLDMSGNVEEWAADWYGEANADLSPRAGASHVLRGGGWLTMPSMARTTSRSWGSVREAGPNVGFRCARDD